MIVDGPPVVQGFDDKKAIKFLYLPPLFLGDQLLMDLLARSYADNFNLTLGCQTSDKISDFHARYFRNKNFTAFHQRQRIKNKVHPLSQGDPKSSHIGMKGGEIFVPKI